MWDRNPRAAKPCLGTLRLAWGLQAGAGKLPPLPPDESLPRRKSRDQRGGVTCSGSHSRSVVERGVQSWVVIAMPGSV